MNDFDRQDPHAAFKTGVNLGFIGLWTAIAAAIFLLSQPRPYLLLSVGLAVGFVVGILERRAIHIQREALERATNLAELKRAIRQSSAGRAARVFEWTAAILLIALWLLHEAKPILGFFCGYFAFMAVKESLGLKTIVWLNSRKASNA